ncbi:MAG: acyl-protein synthetase [Myxococcota bacterium]
MTAERSDLARRIRTLVRDAPGDAARDALLSELATWQAERIPAYGRLLRRRPGAALPTDVFRYARIAVHPAREDVRVFRTSGTTHGARGAHPLRDVSLYAEAALAWASQLLFPDGPDALRLVSLIPSEAEAPDSSLAFMVARFGERFGELTTVWRGGALDAEALAAALSGGPVALLGTSFAFVHAEDLLGDQRFALPPGSRLMQTGGFKGRSREVAPEALRAALGERYGLPETHVVGEYGMTELGSQAYEGTLADALRGAPAQPRRYRFPPWVRLATVHPETLEALPSGERGLLRIDDPINLDSVACVQTSDEATLVDGEVVLHGRAPGARPRGCSLAVEEALGSEAP